MVDCSAYKKYNIYSTITNLGQFFTLGESLQCEGVVGETLAPLLLVLRLTTHVVVCDAGVEQHLDVHLLLPLLGEKTNIFIMTNSIYLSTSGLSDDMKWHLV